jgi:transposase, IS5 family
LAQKKKECYSVKATKNQGKLILDATAAPADIAYPTDLGILNQSRKQTEKLIDSLDKTCQTKLNKKPRTYRKKAHKNYLKVAKKRRPSRKERTDAIALRIKVRTFI